MARYQWYHDTREQPVVLAANPHPHPNTHPNPHPNPNPNPNPNPDPSPNPNQAFTAFDTEGKGYITERDLRRVLGG